MLLRMPEAILRSGAALDRCVDFIDNTKIRCAHPGGIDANQHCMYNGHKRCRCWTYQTLTAPDDLIIFNFGTFEGNQPNNALYSRYGLEYVLFYTLQIDDLQYYIYGDQAYMMR